MRFLHFFLHEFSLRLFIFLIFSHLEKYASIRIFAASIAFFSFYTFSPRISGSKERVTVLSPSHPLGTTLIFLHHALGFLGLTVVMGRLGLLILLLGLLFLLLQLTLRLSYGPRPRRGTRTQQQKQSEQAGNNADSLLHCVLFCLQM
jgi:hypothetical protein